MTFLVCVIVRGVISGGLGQCCLAQVRFYSNSSLNTSRDRGKHFTELLNLKSLPRHSCRPAMPLSPSFPPYPPAPWGLSVSPWRGAGYADSSVGACANAFRSQWASAYLIK